MVMSFEQGVNFENLKHAHKIELETLRHKNAMEELNKQLEIVLMQNKQK